MFRKILAVVPGVLMCMLAACGKIIPGSESRSQIVTKDKVILAGKFVPPKDPQKLTFILLHGLGSGKGEWYGFADKLAGMGYGYLAVDMRGHGESNMAVDGAEVNIKYFGWPGPGSEWSKMTDDVDAMVKYLVVKRGIKKGNIALAGASLGANVTLNYSARHKFVPLAVLLSPGLDYYGIMTVPAMKKYGPRPILIAASPGDSYAYESSKFLMTTVKANGADAVFFEGSGVQHGVQMFDGEFENKIYKWIDSYENKK